MDIGFPFRTVPDLPFYMVVGIAMALLMGVVAVIVSRVAYGAERTRALMPLFGRVTLAWALLAVAAVYVVPFVLAFVIGAPLADMPPSTRHLRDDACRCRTIDRLEGNVRGL